MTRKQRRLVLIAAAGLVLAGAVALILTQLNSSITFFKSPSEIVAEKVAPGTRLRIGGLVETGSVVKADGQRVDFKVTDGNGSLPVRFTGILPDLFREGQGVVAEGVLQGDGSFTADSVLARHDEKYMPREVADALKKQGHWQDDKGNYPASAGAAPAGAKTQ
jgi:cytochrome c-type biogenesis protein CcmE